MPLLRPIRLALMLAAALIAGAALAPDAIARPHDPPVLYPPPPPAPPTPGVGLGARFVQDAAAYQGYMRDTSAISPAFTDASDVARSLRQGVAYEPGQLRRGAVAYAAIAALDDPVFVADLRRAGSSAENRYAIVARIYANPAYAMQFADGANAAGLAKQALAGAGMQLFNAGDAVTSEAYTMQHQPWSLVAVVGLAEREAAAKGLSATPRLPSDADEASLARRVLGDMSGAPALSPAPGPYSPLVVRAVALAALAAIGQAGDAQAGNLGWLTDDYFMDHCLAETKLSLFECLAVARPNYEDAFCLGQHAMKDTGSCVVRGAGSTVPLVILTNPINIPPTHYGAHPPVRRHRA
jgi:hypothetical protein